mmetsp:Transcript_37461/g.64638  ORF Transcript_37461/g.64638 Transcript_37461/m.64638 type:complete len:178 (+) Transcript_37461:283-816(+)
METASSVQSAIRFTTTPSATPSFGGRSQRTWKRIGNDSVFFCTNDFSVYLERIRRNGVWGDDLEIRAMEELIDRSIEIYVAESKEDGTVEPLKTNFDEELTGADVTPIKLSYHGSSHYNSVVDERHPLPIAPRDTSVIYDVRHKRHMDEPPPAIQSSSRRSSFGMTMRGGGWRRKKR